MMVKLLRNSNASERQGTTIVYPDKSAGEALNETTVGDQLLAALRQRMGDASLEFSEPPTRITGGFETLTYGFRLSAVSGDFAGPLVLRLFNQTDAADQGRREEAVQNALAALGYPVPRNPMESDQGVTQLVIGISMPVTSLTCALAICIANSPDHGYWSCGTRLGGKPGVCNAVARVNVRKQRNAS